MQPNSYAQNEKTCPFCGETILAIAIKCKHCGSFLNQSPPVHSAFEATGVKAKRFLSPVNWRLTLLVVVGCLLVVVLVVVNISRNEAPTESDATTTTGQDQIAGDKDIELSNSTVSRRSDRQLLQGTLTNTGSHSAPVVEVWAVFTSFPIAAWRDDKCQGLVRKLLGEFHNLRAGESRQFSYTFSGLIYAKDVPNFALSSDTSIHAFFQGPNTLLAFGADNHRIQGPSLGSDEKMRGCLAIIVVVLIVSALKAVWDWLSGGGAVSIGMALLWIVLGLAAICVIGCAIECVWRQIQKLKKSLHPD